jgi:DNA polymerase elongation subunit (family B)
MTTEFKLSDFNILAKKVEPDPDSDSEEREWEAQSFVIQMFGKNAQGKSACLFVDDYQPFFFVQVGNHWTQTLKKAFEEHIRAKVGKFHSQSIIEFKLIERGKLYGFDANKKHRFIRITFANMSTFNKVKNVWFLRGSTSDEGRYESKLIPGGYTFAYRGDVTQTMIYESNIPPLLRFFHIQDISPSGWISFATNKATRFQQCITTCDEDWIVCKKDIMPLNDKETPVPFINCSFDIEASSSHGDFPVPIKSYKKLATNIVDYFSKTSSTPNKDIMKNIITTAFGFSNQMKSSIDLVYPKQQIQSVDELNQKCNEWLQMPLKNSMKIDASHDEYLIERMFEKMQPKEEEKEKEIKNNDGDDGDDDDNESDNENDADNNCEQEEIKEFSSLDLKIERIDESKCEYNVLQLLQDNTCERNVKINELISSLRVHFPPLEGDKVTFIGSSFRKYGETEPYLRHCIVLNSCASVPVNNCQIESYETEREVLLAWTALIQRENPDIITGYNIFGFDYEFMFRRTQELNCVEDFLKLSRNKSEVCGTPNKKGVLDIDRSSTTLASGTYELAIIKMSGRLQIDLLGYFRKSVNLTSYKLDYVAGQYIGDYVKKIALMEETGKTRISTGNLTGLQVDSFIHFEEINHSSEYYKDGQKFRVTFIHYQEKWFEIDGLESPKAKKIKWGLAKDDVTPKDIFRLTNEGPESRAIVAKYCIQDCDLVHHLFHKMDVLTGLTEMAKLCSVPMSYLVFRGQGIKLTSFVAKKCREKGVLMPVLDKGSIDDAYEGAIVLPPKCGLYLEDPVPVGDFASLYPSSMLSENLCPGSKVWTKIYDLDGNLVKETGEKEPKTGTFIYDNIAGLEYVDVRFDTYQWIQANPKARAKKMKTGYKICRFKQPSIVNGVEEKAVMPSILEELLKARKDTRKAMAKTEDPFMANILDQRQLVIKATANSLYGQLGAKTSTFYEPDVAAATTAVGRMLLTFAKRVVEECYGNQIVETAEGQVRVSAEYVYGDTDSVFFKLNLSNIETGKKIIGEKALELSIPIAKDICHEVSKVLKQPHDFEYEKTFMPFGLLSKKRYFSVKYGNDHLNGKRDQMGMVLKRRDNAPAVKDVYGGVIDIMMNEKDIQKALQFVNTYLDNLIKGKIPMEKLIITKSLRSFYAKPQTIAHKVLADRIEQREPGNKPASGDRIPFVYFINREKPAGGKKMLQGDKIETPAFIVEHGLPIDYSFYITNQLMKPLQQLFGLVLDEIWMSYTPPKRNKVTQLKAKIDEITRTELDEKKRDKKISKLKDKEVEELIFRNYLRETNNVKNGNQSIKKYFQSISQNK